MTEKRMDVYPWAVPTQEQMHMFDALSYEEQLKMVQEAITEGEKNGEASPLDMDEIIKNARSRLTDISPKN